jgi:methionyl-tRNA formyltransferase
MGTPEFAARCLSHLIEKRFNIVAVVTAPDKPAGRGRSMQESAVKKVAVQNSIPVLQPNNLKDGYFVDQLKGFNADLQIIVAFRMLPEVVWNMPKEGSYNLHASLLPHYRGAAPINWVLINGEKTSGICFFKLQHTIDTGDILDSVEVNLDENINAGELHDVLCEKGKLLIEKSINSIQDGNFKLTKQDNSNINLEQREAPKLNRNNTHIDWNGKASDIHNLVRGLSPYPGAWTSMKINDQIFEPVKIYKSNKTNESSGSTNGSVHFEKNRLLISANGEWLEVVELQMPGKAKMDARSFWNGLREKNNVLMV